MTFRLNKNVFLALLIISFIAIPAGAYTHNAKDAPRIGVQLHLTGEYLYVDYDYMGTTLENRILFNLTVTINSVEMHPGGSNMLNITELIYNYTLDFHYIRYVNGTYDSNNSYSYTDSIRTTSAMPFELELYVYNSHYSLLLDVPVAIYPEVIPDFLQSLFSEEFTDYAYVEGHLNGSVYHVEEHDIEFNYTNIYELDITNGLFLHSEYIQGMSDHYERVTVDLLTYVPPNEPMVSEDYPLLNVPMTRAIGCIDSASEITIIPISAFSVGNAHYLYAHARILRYDGRLIDTYLLSGYYDYSIVKPFYFYPLLLNPHDLELEEIHTLESNYTPPFGDESIDITLTANPRGMYGFDSNGLVVARLALETYATFQGSFSSTLGAFIVSNSSNNGFTIDVSFWNASKIEVYIDGEQVESLTLTYTQGSMYINITHSMVAPHRIELYVLGHEDNGLYRYGYNIPKIPSLSVYMSGEGDLVIHVEDSTPIDLIKIYLDSELVKDSVIVTNQNAYIHLPTRYSSIKITVVNPITGLSSSYTLNLTVSNTSPSVSVTYDVNGTNVHFTVSVTDPDDDSFNMRVLVDGEIVKNVTIGHSYEFDLTLSEGTHNVTIIVVDSAGNQATRSKAITISAGEETGGGGEESTGEETGTESSEGISGGINATLIAALVAIIAILAVLIALMRRGE